MTTPVPPRQQSPPAQPPPPQPPPPPSGLDDPALAVTVAAVLAGGLLAAEVIAALKARGVLTAAELGAFSQVLGDVTAHPPPVTGVIGHASEHAARVNTARRTQYVLAAAKRVMGAARDARSKGEPVTAATRKQLATEQRYYAAHQAAMWQRAAAAGKIDMEAAVHGRLLGWYSVRSKTTTPECLEADGHNFYVDNPPDIGLPGIVHVNCKCFPGPPHPGGRLLPGSGPGYARAA